MYFWKCWRDTRSFFIVFLIIAVAIMPVAAVVCMGTGLVAEFGTTAVLFTFGLVGMATAFGLGALGASEEFADQTVHFLFTKPRSRAHFLWVGWAVGCFELLLIAVVNLYLGWATLSRYSRNPFHSALFGSITAEQILGNVILFLDVYCLTYALTALLRNGLKGLGASMGIIFGLPFFAIAIRWRWKINVPIPADHIGILPMMISNIVWIVIALLFVFAAQIVVERTEI